MFEPPGRRAATLLHNKTTKAAQWRGSHFNRSSPLPNFMAPHIWGALRSASKRLCLLFRCLTLVVEESLLLPPLLHSDWPHARLSTQAQAQAHKTILSQINSVNSAPKRAPFHMLNRSNILKLIMLSLSPPFGHLSWRIIHHRLNWQAIEISRSCSRDSGRR